MEARIFICVKYQVSIFEIANATVSASEILSRLEYQVEGHAEENNTSERQRVNYRGELVCVLVRDQVLFDEESHALPLPEEDQIGHDDLDEASQVRHEKGQAEDQPAQYQEEYLQDKACIFCQKRLR